MTNNLGRPTVTVNQADKETALSDSDGILDAALTSPITFTWAGAETLKTATTAETQENFVFIFAGSTSGSPSFKFGSVQRGMVIVQNNMSVTVPISDYASAVTINVPAGDSMAIYVTAGGIFNTLASLAFPTASATDVLTGTDNANGVTSDALAALWEKGADIASAGTITIGEGGYFDVTGTTSITDIDLAVDKTGRRFILQFDASLTLTHGASLILPGAVNFVTAAGDIAEFVSEGSDVVRCTKYTRASGQVVAPASTTTISGLLLTPGVAPTSPVNGDLWCTTGTSFAIRLSGVNYFMAYLNGAQTFTGKKTFQASATGGCFLNVAHGVAPSAPVDGDIWTETTGLYARINGVTQGPYGTGSGFTAASTTEALTGTDSAKGVTPDALAALWEQGSNVASAGTISLGEGGYFEITGTTTITDIDFATDKAGRRAVLKFTGALTLTHGASLILPGGVSITTVAGDIAEFVSEGSDIVRCINYRRAHGHPYLVGTFFDAAPTASEVLLDHMFVLPVTFDTNWAGSLGEVETNPASSFVMDIQKSTAGGAFSNVGTITISTGGAYTFATATNFAAGDRMRILAPATPDASIAGASFTLRGFR